MALKVTGFVEYALLTVDWLWMVVDGYMEYPSSLPPRRLS